MQNSLSWPESVQKKGKAAIPSSIKTKAAASIVYIKETDSRQAML